MNTLFYSLAGIAALIGISLFFTWIGNLRNSKWKFRINAIRNNAFPAPGPLQRKIALPVAPYTRATQNRKPGNFWNTTKNISAN